MQYIRWVLQTLIILIAIFLNKLFRNFVKGQLKVVVYCRYRESVGVFCCARCSKMKKMAAWLVFVWRTSILLIYCQELFKEIQFQCLLYQTFERFLLQTTLIQKKRKCLRIVFCKLFLVCLWTLCNLNKPSVQLSSC